MAGRNLPLPKTPESCPVCGEEVPRGSLACPECGADHNSGWREETDTYDGVDLPEESFNYDEFLREEFGSASKPGSMRALWWITAIFLIVALIVIYYQAAR